MKKALIFGAKGQMGSYLCELLQGKGYEVYCPLFDLRSIRMEMEFYWWIKQFEPQEIYNMASQMYAPDSWKRPMAYMEVNGVAVIKMLEVLAEHPDIRFFQAGSAEVFDKGSVMQDETTNRLPENPYGVSKMLAMEAVRIYREQKGLFACTGIFFNAESPRRKESFFARKAAIEAVRIKKELDATGKFSPAQFGKLEARRDWGWAPEYAEVAWQMLQQEAAADYVIGTGEAHTCREFVLECLKAAGLEKPEERFDEYVKYEKVKEYIPRDTMRAMPWKAKRELGWQAQYKMSDVARMLVTAECAVGLTTTTA